MSTLLLRSCMLLVLAFGSTACGDDADGGPSDDDGSGGSGGGASCDGAGKPEMTGPISGLAVSYAAGDPIDIGVPVDEDTLRVTVGVYEVGSTLYLGGTAEDSSPGEHPIAQPVRRRCRRRDGHVLPPGRALLDERVHDAVRAEHVSTSGADRSRAGGGGGVPAEPRERRRPGSARDLPERHPHPELPHRVTSVAVGVAPAHGSMDTRCRAGRGARSASTGAREIAATCGQEDRCGARARCSSR